MLSEAKFQWIIEFTKSILLNKYVFFKSFFSDIFLIETRNNYIFILEHLNKSRQNLKQERLCDKNNNILIFHRQLSPPPHHVKYI